MSLDFSQIEKAGITQTQFGDLVGVTRVTVSTWVNGRYSPRGAAQRERVRRALTLLGTAVAKNRLPVTEDHRTSLIEHELQRVARTLAKQG